MNEESEKREVKKKVDEEWKAQARKEKEEAQAKVEAAKTQRQQLPRASFQLFVSGLATQALMALGQVPNPITKKVQVDLDQAKYTIDILAMLEEKTRGNLTPDEKKFLDQIIYDLRMRFVKAAGA